MLITDLTVQDTMLDQCYVLPFPLFWLLQSPVQQGPSDSQLQGFPTEFLNVPCGFAHVLLGKSSRYSAVLAVHVRVQLTNVQFAWHGLIEMLPVSPLIRCLLSYPKKETGG